MILSFLQNEIPFVSKEKRALEHYGNLVRNFVNDFLLFDKILLSVKCVPCNILRAHYIKLFSELKLWQKDLGLIVNFGLLNLEIKRIAFHEKAPVFSEDYAFIKDITTNEEKYLLTQIIKSIKNVAGFHKPGYGKSIWQKMMQTEFERQSIAYSKNSIVPVQFAGKAIRKFRLRHFIAENKVILGITALQKSITHFDIASMQSYLKGLRLRIGLMVNFGKEDVQIFGVRAVLS